MWLESLIAQSDSPTDYSTLLEISSSLQTSTLQLPLKICLNIETYFYHSAYIMPCTLNVILFGILCGTQYNMYNLSYITSCCVHAYMDRVCFFFHVNSCS